MRSFAQTLARYLSIESEKGVTAIEYGLIASLIAVVIIVAVAAVAVTQIGPEAKGLALDEIAPPTA